MISTMQDVFEAITAVGSLSNAASRKACSERPGTPGKLEAIGRKEDGACGGALLCMLSSAEIELSSSMASR
jgi:hypothetical protein